MQQTSKQLDMKKLFGTVFLKGLAVFFFACLAIALAGLFWLWGFLGRYEMQTPDAALREYTALISQGDYEALFNRGDFKLTEFNTKDIHIEHLRKVYSSSENIRYAKKTSPNKELIYAVYIDGNEAGTIQLNKNESGSGPALYAKPLIESNVNIKITAPKYAQVFLDDQPVNDGYVVSQMISKDFAKAPEALAPKQVVYEIKELISMPQITAKANARSCVIVEEKGEYHVVAAVSGIDMPEYEKLIEKAVKTYATFVSDDAPLRDVLALSMKDSPFSNSIRNFSNFWYNDHDNYEFVNFKITDIIEHSETAFSGEVSFDYVVKLGKTKNTFPSKYATTFLKENGVWKLYNLITL